MCVSWRPPVACRRTLTSLPPPAVVGLKLSESGALMVVGGEKGNVTLRRACLTKAWLPCPHPTINNQL